MNFKAVQAEQVFFVPKSIKDHHCYSYLIKEEVLIYIFSTSAKATEFIKFQSLDAKSTKITWEEIIDNFASFNEGVILDSRPGESSQIEYFDQARNNSKPLNIDFRKLPENFRFRVLWLKEDNSLEFRRDQNLNLAYLFTSIDKAKEALVELEELNTEADYDSRNPSPEQAAKRNYKIGMVFWGKFLREARRFYDGIILDYGSDSVHMQKFIFSEIPDEPEDDDNN